MESVETISCQWVKKNVGLCAFPLSNGQADPNQFFPAFLFFPFFSFIYSSKEHDFQMGQWMWISTRAIFISTTSSSCSVGVPRVHLPIAFGGGESLRNQMFLSLKEYHDLKNNIHHIALFSVHYFHAVPIFKGWWGKFCCGFTNALPNGVYDSLNKDKQDPSSTVPAPPFHSLGVPGLFPCPEGKLLSRVILETRFWFSRRNPN